MFTRIGTTLAVFALLSACDDSEPAAVTEPAESTELTEVEMVTLMEGHYGSAIGAHDAVIRGNVETVKERLAEIPTQTLPAAAPEHWRPLHEQLHQSARDAACISSVEEAGLALASVTEACGRCHDAVQFGAIYRQPEPPTGETERETAMLRHQWATERLWEGVTGPWDDAWNRGAAALAESAVLTAEASEGLQARQEAMRETGRRAQTVEGLHDRTVIYGQLLSTCAGCHEEAGVVFPEASD